MRSAPEPIVDHILVRGEVWRSLVSLLRVYSNAASLHHGKHPLIEETADAILLRHNETELEVCFHLNDGKGSWRVRQPGRLSPHGSFRISDTGVMTLNGRQENPLELDEAAIQWVGDFTEATKRENPKHRNTEQRNDLSFSAEFPPGDFGKQKL